MKKDPTEFQVMTMIFVGLALFALTTMASLRFPGILPMFMASIVGASGTFFLHDVCFPPGKIFGWWIPFVERKFRDNPKNPFAFLANPLGLCAYCQNIWIGLFTFAIMDIKLDMNWWLLLPSLFLCHLFLVALDKTFWS